MGYNTSLHNHKVMVLDVYKYICISQVALFNYICYVLFIKRENINTMTQKGIFLSL